jgi:hypothetical protein
MNKGRSRHYKKGESVVLVSQDQRCSDHVEKGSFVSLVVAVIDEMRMMVMMRMMMRGDCT